MFFEKLSLRRLDGTNRPHLGLDVKAKRPSIDLRSNETSELRRFLLNVKDQNVSDQSSMTKLYRGDLLLHTLQRAVGTESNMNLSMLNRMTHPLLYNTERCKESDLLVGGALLIAMTHSVASKELYEVVYEELLDSRIVNKVNDSVQVDMLEMWSKIHYKTAS